jgi:hypothetical protein
MLQHAPHATKAPPPPEPPAFSLIRGGLLFRCCRRAHVSGDALELLHRRVLAFTLLTWLPLCLLSLIDGRAFGGAIKIPFFYDVETHARFLLALPLLIAAEVIVDERISPLIGRFVERRIVRTGDIPAFNAAVTSALRVRDSIALEAPLLILVYTLGLWVSRSAVAPDVATWYTGPADAGSQFSWAGYWYAFVSIPLFQFVLLRWYLRLLIWFRLLWHISRLDLHLTAEHPDGAGGIGFLGRSAYAFSPILFAQGAVVAGMIATRILYEGKTLPAFTMEAVSWIVMMVLFVLGPLVMFTPQLERARRKGQAEYGSLASEYVFAFEEKWLRRGSGRLGGLLGSSDIQSLADLANSHGVVGRMRLVPFGTTDIFTLVLATAAPLLPLALTMFSAEELLHRLLTLFFR